MPRPKRKGDLTCQCLNHYNGACGYGWKLSGSTFVQLFRVVDGETESKIVCQDCARPDVDGDQCDPWYDQEAARLEEERETARRRREQELACGFCGAWFPEQDVVTGASTAICRTCATRVVDIFNTTSAMWK